MAQHQCLLSNFDSAIEYRAFLCHCSMTEESRFCQLSSVPLVRLYLCGGMCNKLHNHDSALMTRLKSNRRCRQHWCV